MKIKDIHIKDRPREKLIELGVDRLADEELIAILLRTGVKGKSAVELGSEILKLIQEIGLDRLQLTDLNSIKGLGKAKSAEIFACFEIGKRFLKDKKTHVYQKPEDVWNALTDIRNSKKEHFVALYLDSRSSEINREIISIGNLTSSLVHPREVFEPAIRNYSASVMLAHNHPSGSLEESESDIEVTKKLVAAGKILSIKIVDHIIVTKDGYNSLNSKFPTIFS